MRENKHIESEKDIDLLALAQKLWNHKIFIVKVIGIGVVIGLIVAFSIPKEYTTTVILTPDAQTSGSSSMSSLASLAGINLNNSSNGDVLASPDLYPDIFQSTPFLKGLFGLKVKDSQQNIDTTLYTYMGKEQKRAWWTYVLGVPKLIMGLFSTSSASNIVDSVNMNRRLLSREELNVIGGLKGRISIASDKRTFITTIEVTMQSPEISAFIADTLTSYFQSYIIDYRTQKAREDLAFTEKLYEEAKTDYYNAQQRLATFADGNLNVVSEKYRIAQARLQNEADLAYYVYKQTAQQVQMARVKVQNTTPVFTVIQPAIQPLLPSKPSKKIILVGVVFICFVGAVFWVLKKDLFKIFMN